MIPFEYVTVIVKMQDLAIAATAAAHRLTVLTGNTKHFVHLGVPMHNPFEFLP